MRYYKYQAAFFAVIAALYLSSTWIYYRLELSDLRQNQLSEFQDIVLEKEKLMGGLRSKEDEAFPNYKHKLFVVERVMQPYLAKIGKDLKHKNWKKRLQKTMDEIPLKEVMGIYVGRPGKLLFSIGNKFNNIFEKNWEQRIFLALKFKGEQFSNRMSELYIYPMTRPEWDNYQDQFQVLYQKGHNFLHRYYTMFEGYGKRKFSTLLLIDLWKADPQTLKQGILDLYLSRSHKIMSGTHNVFRFGREQIVLSTNKDYGLHYIADRPSYLSFLVDSIWINLYFLIFASILFYYGGYRVIATRFEFKFYTTYLFYLYLAVILFLVMFKHSYTDRKFISLNKLQTQWRSQLTELEAGFEKYLKMLETKFIDDFQNERGFDPSYWVKGFHGVQLDYDRKVTLSRYDIHPQSKNKVVRLIPYLIAKHPLYKGPDDPNLIAKEYGLDKHISETMIGRMVHANNKSTTSEDLRKALTVGTSGSFKVSRVLESNLYMLWDKKSRGEQFKVFNSILSEDVLMQDYFKRHYQDYNSPDILAVQSLLWTDEFYSPRSEIVDQLILRDALLRFSSTPDVIHRFEIQGKTYLCSVLPSSKFMNYRFVYFRALDDVQGILDKYRNEYKNFEKLLIFLSVAMMIFLSVVVLRPLSQLAIGLHGIREGDLEVCIPPSGKDELSRVMSQFNTMASELKQRQEMIPFLSRSVLNILYDESGENQGYSGKAAVLFSDIRSFTTISETHDPEEVVKMLNDYFSIWQQKVERYQGVIDCFIGDAVRVVFFESNTKHYHQVAVQCALEVIEELAHFNSQRDSAGQFEVKIGVGIASGEIRFSVVGNEQKMEFLVLGKPVNLSETLETESIRGQSSRIILDQTTYEQTKYHFDFLNFDSLQHPDDKFFELDETQKSTS